MKPVRLLLIGLGVVALLLASVTVLAFNPGVQTWAVRKTIRSQPGLAGTVDKVSAGLKQVEAWNMRLERDGAVLTVPSLTVELPVIDAGLNRKVLVKRLVAKGWVLDLSRATRPPRSQPAQVVQREFSLISSALAAEAPVPAPAALFRGVFSQLGLPFDFSLEGVELEGEIILPPMQGQPSARVKVILAGGGLGAGREGKFLYDLSANSGAGVAPISAHALRGKLQATMDSPRSFSAFAAQAEASVSGTQFPRGVKLNLEIAASREPGLEKYQLALADGDKPLAQMKAEFPVSLAPTANSQLRGNWKLNLRDPDLAPFVLGVPLPVFAVEGSGEFQTNAAFVEARATGTLDLAADKLGALRRELAPMGAVRLAANFAVARKGDFVRIEKLNADLSGARPMMSLRALQPFEFNPVTRELTANPAQDLFGIVLQGVPVAWTQPFWPDVAIEGGDLRGEFVASAGGDGLVLRAKAPLTVGKLAVARAGKPLLADVDVELTASADYTPQGWQAVIASLTAKTGNSTWLRFEGKAGQLAGQSPVKTTGAMQVDLPVALAQPWGTEVPLRLVAGRASLDFSGSIAATQEILAKLSLRELAVDPQVSPEKLPDLAAEIRADRAADGKISLHLPVTIARGERRSDLAINGSVLPGNKGVSVDAAVSSEELRVEDLMLLTALSSSGRPTPGGKNPLRDAAPFWDGVTGKLTLALKRVIYSDDFQATDVSGTVRIEAGEMKVETVRAVTGQGGEMRLSGDVLFNSRVMEPYSLQAELALENFDSAPFFRLLAPGRPATVEGRFSGSSRVRGSGANLSALMEKSRGEVQLISKAGLFRGLRSDTAEAIKAAPSALSGLVNGIGSLLGKDAAEKAEKLGGDINKRGKAVSDIAVALAEIPYDQLSVSLVRDASLNLELKDFTLISPEVRLGGTGTVAYRENLSVLAQPLDLRLQIAARGKMAELMKRVSLLGDAQDSLGYAAFAFPVRISGSIAEPDVSELKRELMKVAAGSLLNNLMGR